MARHFRSMRGAELLRLLAREPLRYEVVRRRGSHRTLVSRTGYRTILVSFHDRQEVQPYIVRKVLLHEVGLSEQEALDLL